MKVKIKLEKGAEMPSYSREGDCGMDLKAISEKVVNEKDHGFIEYDTGISLEIPEGYVGLIFPRGSVSNTGLILANAVGVSDSNYRGTLKCRFKHIPETKKYEVGDRVAQLVILPYPQIEFEQVEELSETNRGEAGFGSSGN